MSFISLESALTVGWLVYVVVTLFTIVFVRGRMSFISLESALTVGWLVYVVVTLFTIVFVIPPTVFDVVLMTSLFSFCLVMFVLNIVRFAYRREHGEVSA